MEAALPQAVAAPAAPARMHTNLRPLLRLIVPVPVLMLLFWWLATLNNPNGLIPSPREVWLALWDLAVGGINDDAFSQMLLPDLVASASWVYGAFILAALLALPLGMLIGRLRIVRDLLEPTFQLLRPVPVTAWLPL